MSSEEIAVRVNALSKCYQIYDKPEDRLKQSIVPRLQSVFHHKPTQYFREFWALRNISFEIKKGETVGIIGCNGSGKSTLLQIICGTSSPTSGFVETNGRIAALLELGSGFNPEFTGRENVYMNAALLGLTKGEIDFRFNDIAVFADIGNFIEQPVKTYSSGMYLRLAFAVNIMSTPDIMIVDEALAVGDMNFQSKCMTALTRIQERGTTVLFVSHDIGALKSLCSRGIYLEHGEIQEIGKASDVAEKYIRAMHEKMNAEVSRLPPVSPAIIANPIETGDEILAPLKNRNMEFKRSNEFDKWAAPFRYGSGAKITYVELLDLNDNSSNLIEFDQEVKIRIYVETSLEQKISINFNIYDDKKINLTGSDLFQAESDLLNSISGGLYLVEYVLRLPLQEGNYSVRAQVTLPTVRDETAEFLDVIENAVVFKMARRIGARSWSKIYLNPKLSLKKLHKNAI